MQYEFPVVDRYRSFNFIDSKVDALETLSKDDDDISKTPEKMNLRSFKLNCVYLDPVNMSNADDVSGAELLRILLRFKTNEGK